MDKLVATKEDIQQVNELADKIWTLVGTQPWANDIAMHHTISAFILICLSVISSISPKNPKDVLVSLVKSVKIEPPKKK